MFNLCILETSIQDIYKLLLDKHFYTGFICTVIFNKFVLTFQAVFYSKNIALAIKVE
jgi:hypothetical protein